MPRYKHSAVERNRVKRRLREQLRLLVLPELAGLPVPLDVVVRALPSAYQKAFDGMERELRAALRDLRRMAGSLAPSDPAPRTEP